MTTTITCLLTCAVFLATTTFGNFSRNLLKESQNVDKEAAKNLLRRLLMTTAKKVDIARSKRRNATMATKSEIDSSRKHRATGSRKNETLQERGYADESHYIGPDTYDPVQTLPTTESSYSHVHATAPLIQSSEPFPHDECSPLERQACLEDKQREVHRLLEQASALKEHSAHLNGQATRLEEQATILHTQANGPAEMLTQDIRPPCVNAQLGHPPSYHGNVECQQHAPINEADSVPIHVGTDKAPIQLGTDNLPERVGMGHPYVVNEREGGTHPYVENENYEGHLNSGYPVYNIPNENGIMETQAPIEYHKPLPPSRGKNPYEILTSSQIRNSTLVG